MSATDQLFFALFPPVTTAARIYALQQDLRVRHGLWGRALAIERLHVMLCHVGDYAGLPSPVVDRALEAAGRVRAPEFDVSLDRAMSFSGRTRNRPFVLRSEQGTHSVEAFQRTLGAQMKACGLGKFVRPYTPHITLLYDTAEVGEQEIEPVTWRTTEFRLVHSMLGQTRLVTLGSWSLDGQAAAAPVLERTG